MKTADKLFLILLFLTINLSVYFILHINAGRKIDILLNQNLNLVQTHYKILLENQKKTAKVFYQFTLETKALLAIISQANEATTEEKEKLREEFHRLIAPKYQIMKQKGVLQYHFTLRNNESFYRAHKPSKFGDDLTDIRADFNYTNTTHQPTRGLVQGRLAHGFRNTFPLFNQENQHIGAMEVSFSHESFEWYLNHISNVHTHFLINKKIFKKRSWAKESLVLNYEESSENSAYMISKSHQKDKTLCISYHLNGIDSKMKLNQPFSFYTSYEKDIYTLSFLPIENINHKITAWLIAYHKSPLISEILYNSFIILTLTFLISLFILYIFIKRIKAKEKIDKQTTEIQKQKHSLENQHNLLNEIFNATTDIFIITDFKTIKFANQQLYPIEEKTFPELIINQFDNLFHPLQGYLHKALLKPNETYHQLIQRTKETQRIVSILSKNNTRKDFKISSIALKNREEYLITLSDITPLNQKLNETEKMAYTDSLTKIYNRKKFDTLFHQEFKRVERYHSALSIALLDIDHFKKVNDTYGHLIGDEVLISLANILNNSVRDTDIFARWGGEEFILLFINTPLKEALKVVQTLQEKIAQTPHPIAGTITASFGLSQYKQGDSKEDIFKRCDDALFQAKKRGRDRVEVL